MACTAASQPSPYSVSCGGRNSRGDYVRRAVDRRTADRGWAADPGSRTGPARGDHASIGAPVFRSVHGDADGIGRGRASLPADAHPSTRGARSPAGAHHGKRAGLAARDLRGGEENRRAIEVAAPRARRHCDTRRTGARARWREAASARPRPGIPAIHFREAPAIRRGSCLPTRTSSQTSAR